MTTTSGTDHGHQNDSGGDYDHEHDHEHEHEHDHDHDAQPITDRVHDNSWSANLEKPAHGEDTDLVRRQALEAVEHTTAGHHVNLVTHGAHGHPDRTCTRRSRQDSTATPTSTGSTSSSVGVADT